MHGAIREHVRMPSAAPLIPSVQWLGSKKKLLPWILPTLAPYRTIYEPFSGSAAVGFALRQQGKRVIANDQLLSAAAIARATIGNPGITLTDDDVALLLASRRHVTFLTDLFGDRVFLHADTLFLDRLRPAIDRLRDPIKRTVALAAACSAMIKKSSFGRFNIGLDNHLTPVKLPKHRARPLQAYFIEGVAHFNGLASAVGPVGEVYNCDALEMPEVRADAAYVDMPYPTRRRKADYGYSYHVPELFVAYDQNAEPGPQGNIYRGRVSPFTQGKDQLAAVIERFLLKIRNIPTWIISYASHCLPGPYTLKEMLWRTGRTVKVIARPANYAKSVWSGEGPRPARELLFIATK